MITLKIDAAYSGLPEETVSTQLTQIQEKLDPGEKQNATEEHTNGLIADLAWILVLGAIVTLVFKKLKQPVVLGYILAGFLASPNFAYIPSISNLDNIHFWAEIGIVVLMFTLGLEFSFKKLMN